MYLESRRDIIADSAARHGVPAAWLGAVLYNEMLGTEDCVLRSWLPGENAAAQTTRQVLLGLHFLTLKQLQYQTKTLLALLGADPTLGPAGIRVSVGREIRVDEPVVGGVYVADGWLERPSMVLDLNDPDMAVEYLAANLRRGQDRLSPLDRGDWAASARWHNTGVVYDSEIVRLPDWEKGSRYIQRVEGYLPQITAVLGLDGVDDMEATARPPRGWQKSDTVLLRQGQHLSP